MWRDHVGLQHGLVLSVDNSNLSPITRCVYVYLDLLIPEVPATTPRN